MDPRKTIKIADFDRIVQEADRPSVVVARKVITVGQPRSSVGMAKTQLWGSELAGTRETVPSGSDPTPLDSDVRPRAKVELKDSLVQRLAAELWAGQASHGPQTMITTLNRVLGDSPTYVEPRLEPAKKPDAQAQPREEDADPIELPRRFQLPSPKAVRMIRIACGALCALSLAIASMSGAGWLDGRSASGSSVGARGASDNTAKSVAKPAAPSGAKSEPVAVESTWGPVRSAPVNAAAAAPTAKTATAQTATAQTGAGAVTQSSSTNAPTTTGDVTPRMAVDALIAGKPHVALARYRALASKNPAQPAYEAAARILAETEQREQEGL